jgi:pimeloyl-ACP methyl ester carboxylesterase
MQSGFKRVGCVLGVIGLWVGIGFAQTPATQPAERALPDAGVVDIQDKAVFPISGVRRAGTGLLPAGAVVLKRELEGGGTVEGWYAPAPGASKEKPRPLIVYCHGNAELIDQQLAQVKRFHKMGWSVLLPEYRGYGRSGGRPTQEAIREDAAWFLDEVLKRPEVDGERVVFVGRSLGGGVAADLASVRKPQGLVLISTFTSVTAMMHGFGVSPDRVKYPFRTDKVVKGFEGPVLVFHGVKDGVIPVEHGRELGRMAKQGTYVELACDHNDFPGAEGGLRGKYSLGLEAFLATVPRKAEKEAAATQGAGQVK